MDLWDTNQTSREGQLWPEFVSLRAPLPCKYGGSGVSHTTSFVETAFVNSITQCVSQFFSYGTESDGGAREMRTGLFDHLRPMFRLENSPTAFLA